MSATKRVILVKACNFTDASGKLMKLEPGDHDLPAEIADHWFILAHTDNPPKSDPPVGTPEYAVMLAKKKAQQKIFEAAIAQQAEHDVRQQRGRK
jgi:hypothetical protein